MFYSADKRYIVKQMSRAECRLLLRPHRNGPTMLEAFANHARDLGGQTMLLRIVQASLLAARIFNNWTRPLSHFGLMSECGFCRPAG